MKPVRNIDVNVGTIMLLHNDINAHSILTSFRMYSKVNLSYLKPFQELLPVWISSPDFLFMSQVDTKH